MSLRKKSGGTLALIAAATITIILIGIAFFFFAQIFGGEREMQHATDSGNLNVAKNALRHPTVTPAPGIEAENFGQLGDRTLIGDADPPSVAPINLLTYNRCVAQCLLACLNAVVDPGPGNIAVTHANDLVKALQEGDTSIGGRLSTQLSKKSGNELFVNFGDTANSNSLRMLGKDSVLGHQDNAFDVAFLEQSSGDLGATNIVVHDSLKNLLSTELQEQLITRKGSTNFLRGYTSPALSGLSRPVGVPLQPGDQPHLVSNKTFTNDHERGEQWKNAMVPPNGFKSTAFAEEERTKQQAGTISAAIVGSLNLTFPLAAPYGYIQIVNGPDGTSGSAPVTGPFAGLNHVLNNELLKPPGILVAGPVFSTNLPLEQSWAKYNWEQKNGVPQGQQPTPKPDLDGLYKLDGSPAKEADAKQIPFKDSDGTLQSNQCKDDNVTGLDPSTVNAQCADLFTKGIFDQVYHPDGGYKNGVAKADNLISVECAKCKLQAKFNACGDLSIDSGDCPVTGMRTFQKGVELPSPSMGNCKVSNEASVEGLSEFVKSGFGARMATLIADRAKQINPTNGDSQARALLSQNTLPLGAVAYIFAPKPDGKTAADKNLIWSTTAPPWIDPSEQPDGTPESASSDPYDIVGELVNPHKDGGIHDIMYRETPSSGILGTDTATFTPSSGFKNLLGKAQFFNKAEGYASGFCKPD